MSTSYLTAMLYAPLASFGYLAVGERRGTGRYPTRSQLIGLIGAALGIERADEDMQARLRDSYAFAIQIFASGRVASDYHTAQMPWRGKVRFATRRDELSDKQNLNTVLTTRDYRHDFLAGLAISAHEGAPFSLQEIGVALKAPHYTLSFGRKSCPFAWPLSPQLGEAKTAQAALADLWQREVQNQLFKQLAHALKAKPGEIILEREQVASEASQIEFVRDQPLSRRRWQFGLREVVVVQAKEGGL